MSARGPLSVLSYIWHHPSNRGRRVRAVLRAIAWQLYKRGFGGVWDVRLTHNRIIRCHAKSTSASSVLYAGLFDFDAMHFVLRYLRATDNFLDVGANIGVYTILASTVVTEGTLHALEPSGRERLEENVQINGLTNVRVYPVAAAEGVGFLQITRDLDSEDHIVVNESHERLKQVPCDALQNVVGAIPFALGKMDVEGYELPALKGAVRMLERHNPPVWLIEVGPLSVRYGYSAEQLVRYLRHYGYVPAVYRADRNTLRRDDTCWKRGQNVLVIAESRFARVGQRLSR